MNRKRFFHFFLGLIFFTALRTDAIVGISVSGTWLESIDSSDLIIGSEVLIPSTTTSADNAVTLDVSTDTNAAWTVYVSAVDANWDPRLHLYLRRTGAGTGKGSVSGGETFLEISPLNQVFFSGRKAAFSIPVQFQINGISFQIPPSVFIKTITYTITE